MSHESEPSIRTIDIVVPLWNEETMVPLLIDRLESVFSASECALHEVASWRVVFVDDGSTDGTAAIIAARIQRGLPAICIRLSRNFGHQAAVSAGLDHTDADAVAIIDADLQDPPEMILTLLAQIRAGYDVAYARRESRRESLLKRIGYWAFYRIIALLSDTRVPLDSGDFCVIRRRVVLAMRTLTEHVRFPRVLRAWVGFRQVGVGYQRPARVAGSSKYTWRRLYRLATDGIASASIQPLRLAQIFAWCYMLIAAAALIGFFGARSAVVGKPMYLVSILLVANISGLGLVMFCLYILGAYIGRMYLEVKGRPTYIVMEILGCIEREAR